MEQLSQFVQGKTGNQAANITINIAKGALGAFVASRLPGRLFPATTAVAVAAITQGDHYKETTWTFNHGVTSFGRGLQLGAAAVLLSRSAPLLAGVCVLEPVVFAFWAASGADEGERLEDAVWTLGLFTPNQ